MLLGSVAMLQYIRWDCKLYWIIAVFLFTVITASGFLLSTLKVLESGTFNELCRISCYEFTRKSQSPQRLSYDLQPYDQIF